MGLPISRTLLFAIIGGITGAIAGYLLGGAVAQLLFGNEWNAPAPDRAQAVRNWIDSIPIFWGCVLGIIVVGLSGTMIGVWLGAGIEGQIPPEPLAMISDRDQPPPEFTSERQPPVRPNR